jgi:hypothetical protein
MTMITKTRITLAAAILLGAASAASAASAGALPSIDIETLCRASEASPFADNTETFDVCMSDERSAREKLVEDWANIPAKDKSRCVLPAEYLPGYSEWLTCLEMERDFREIRQRQRAGQPARMPPGRDLAAAYNVVSGKR